MSTTTASTQAYGPPDRSEPPFAPALVEEMLKLLVKAVRAHQLYLHNNPIYLRALDLVKQAFQAIIGREAREQMLATAGRLPRTVVACVGGGSNAMGSSTSSWA
ncbi:MAG TPA: hypothetical protein VFZ11_08220, partial [Gemmatimonadaceae bacterium]